MKCNHYILSALLLMAPLGFGQETPKGEPALVNPIKPSLDAPDAVALLKAQRENYYAMAEVNKLRAEMESKRAEMNAAQGRLELRSRIIAELLVNFRVRYNCPGCNISGDMQWVVPEPPKQEEGNKDGNTP